MLKSHKPQNKILRREYEIKNKLIFYVFQYRRDYYNISYALKMHHSVYGVYTFFHNNNCFGSCIFTFYLILLLFSRNYVMSNVLFELINHYTEYFTKYAHPIFIFIMLFSNSNF